MLATAISAALHGVEAKLVRHQRRPPLPGISMGTMADDDEPLREAVPQGVSIVGHWGYLLDNLPDEMGGGYFAGEFLLRSDGVLLWRPVSDTVSGNIQRYKALGPWKVFHRFGPDAGEAAVKAWLRSRNYELNDSPNIPAEAELGPEIPFSTKTQSAPGPLSRGLASLSLILAIPLLVLGLLFFVVAVVLAILDPGDWIFALVGALVGLPLAWLGMNALDYGRRIRSRGPGDPRADKTSDDVAPAKSRGES